MTTDTMTRAEREDLQRLIRQREKVLKSAAKQRSANCLLISKTKWAPNTASMTMPSGNKRQKQSPARSKRPSARLPRVAKTSESPERFAPDH